MTVAQTSTAAATATLGFDLLGSSVHRQSGINRRIVGVGLAGSAAVLDSEINLFVGSQLIGNFFNSSLLAVTRDVDMFPLNTPVRAGVEVRAQVVNAPATNPLNLVVDFRP